VHDDDCLRALRDRRLDGLGRDAERLWVHVAEHGARAGQRDGLGGRVERERGDDDLVAGADAHPAQREGDGVGPVADADRVAGAEVVGELGLEGADLRAEDEAAGLDDLADLRLDGVDQRLNRRASVEEGYWHWPGVR
jgi:hypothetical protein